MAAAGVGRRERCGTWSRLEAALVRGLRGSRLGEARDRPHGRARETPALAARRRASPWRPAELEGDQEAAHGWRKAAPRRSSQRSETFCCARGASCDAPESRRALCVAALRRIDARPSRSASRPQSPRRRSDRRSGCGCPRGERDRPRRHSSARRSLRGAHGRPPVGSRDCGHPAPRRAQHAPWPPSDALSRAQRSMTPFCRYSSSSVSAASGRARRCARTAP